MDGSVSGAGLIRKLVPTSRTTLSLSLERFERLVVDFFDDLLDQDSECVGVFGKSSSVGSAVFR